MTRADTRINHLSSSNILSNINSVFIAEKILSLEYGNEEYLMWRDVLMYGNYKQFKDSRNNLIDAILARREKLKVPVAKSPQLELF